MRRTFILLLLLLLATPLFAQSSPERWSASVFGVQHGFGAAIAYAPAPAWDIEAAVAEQSYHWLLTTTGPPISPGSGSIPVTIVHHYDAHPADLFVTRHFADEARVSPYLRVGARYAAGRGPGVYTYFVDQALPVTQPVYGHRTSAQAGAGARVRLTPRLALRVEAVRLLRSDEAEFDPLTRAAAGLSWRF